jgi:hypothetical protein
VQSLASEVKLMKEKTECYPYYEKLMKMKLEQSVVETTEYTVLAKRYPHLTESIRLKREIEGLKNKLKTEKERSSRFQIKREMNATRAKLKRENILKLLHGESKQETIFHIHFIIDTSKEHISLLAMRGHMILLKTYKSVQKKIRRSMYRKLPPTVLDLKSLDTTEKGLAVKEWVQNRKKEKSLAKSSSF